MKLGLGVQIVFEPFPFQPGQKTPFCGRDVAARSAGDGIASLCACGDMVDWFRPVERQRGIRIGIVVAMFGVGIPFQIISGIYRGCWRKGIRMNIVTTTAEIVVRIPVDIGSSTAVFDAGSAGATIHGKEKKSPVSVEACR